VNFAGLATQGESSGWYFWKIVHKNMYKQTSYSVLINDPIKVRISSGGGVCSKQIALRRSILVTDFGIY